MDRGVVMVSDVIRLINIHREAAESSQTSCQSLSESQRKQKRKEQSQSQAIKLVRRDRDLLGRVLRLHPQLSSPHIYKLFGFVGINERALQDPSHEESFFKTHLHGRIIERVQIYDNAIVVEMVAPQPSPDQLAVAQIIEAYKRRGCMKFYELANQIQDLMELFGGMEGSPAPPEKPESLKKCLDSLGDSMFVCTSGIRKVAISKSLLTYLEYDIQEFCVEAVKFRGIFAELFSAHSYFSGITHILALLKYTIQLANNQISLSEFRELSTFRFSDFIHSKNQVKSYCDMSLSLLNPSMLCHKVNYIYYREKEPWRTGKLPAIENQKERVRQGEYQVIRKVKNIPNSLLTENQQLIAGYKMVREQSDTDSIHESNHSL